MNRQYVSKFTGVLAALGLVGLTVPGNAQTVTPFQLVGHIEKFTLDTPADTFSAAKLTVNGIQVTIPRNLVIQFPAAYLTAQQAFEKAQGVSKRNNESGLALNDQIPPLAAFEVAVDGNIVDGEYRAGLVSISQQSLNAGAGFIHSIDTTQPPSKTGGMMCVGASPTAITCQPGDTRIRVNDPVITDNDDLAKGDGRYGQKNPPPDEICAPGLPGPTCANNPNSRYPDPRFQVDQDNPTVHALTGFPMCVPRTANDLKCPASNRPSGLKTFVMSSEVLQPPVNFGLEAITACPTCDATKQAPLQVGDYVTFAGTFASQSDPIDLTNRAKDQRYVSVHTLVANIGIYTAEGVNPAYVTLDESLIGTMGPLAQCVGLTSTAECQDRIKIEGFTTDPSRAVRLYALDSVQGSSTPVVRQLTRDIRDQAVYGRFRFVTGKNARAMFDSNGQLRGATRELMVRIDNSLSKGGSSEGSPLADGTPKPELKEFANGLEAGQYTGPVGEYIFPEPTGVLGGPLPALNFECLAFLVNGWSPDESTTTAQLSPWPGALAPSSVACSQ